MCYNLKGYFDRRMEEQSPEADFQIFYWWQCRKHSFRYARGIKMELLFKINLNNAVERVLHVPGNYSGGILEMTLVIDCALPADYVRTMSADIAATLRSHSEVFRNVRLNLLYFKGDDDMENRVIPISFLQTSRCFEDYVTTGEEKSLDALTAKLKLFHARSKLILVLADEKLLVRDRDEVQRNLKPFLGKKSLFLYRNDPEMKWRRGIDFNQPAS